jgi:hypothetical protein
MPTHKSRSTRKTSDPLFSATMIYRRKGKSYLHFSISLFVIAGLVLYLIKQDNPSAGWTSAGALITVLACGIPGSISLVMGISYYTRVTLIQIFRDMVVIRTRTFFSKGLAGENTPLSAFEGVAMAPEKNKTVLRYYVFLCHRDSRRSIALERDIEGRELAESRRDQLARSFKVPVLETAENGLIVDRVKPGR